MDRTSPLIPVAVLLVGLGLGACAPTIDVTSTDQKSADGKAALTGFTRFPDLPLPTAAKIDLEHTLVFGAGEAWFGRLALGVNHSVNDVFGFYKRELPRFGWQEITTTRSKVSTMTYTREGRVATILIESGALIGSNFSITVSPRGAPVQEPTTTNQPTQPAQ
jgi:hypothetical protein